MPTATVGSADDGMNVISWANGMPDGVLASSRSYVSGGVISQCDIQFSNAYVWGAGEAGSRDIQSTGMHEVGHWLKLLDQYMDADSTKVMCGYGSAGVQKRALSAADIAGITWAYPLKPSDTVGPVCSAKNATVRRGNSVRLYLKVHDALSAKVTMKLAITTQSGSVKKTSTRGYGRIIPDGGT